MQYFSETKFNEHLLGGREFWEGERKDRNTRIIRPFTKLGKMVYSQELRIQKDHVIC